MHETQAIKVVKTQLFEKRIMKESILIRNFGPISEVVIEDIKPLTIFIGESGSGKSTVVKVIALFRWIYKMMCIRTFLKSSKIKKTYRFRMDTYLKNNEQDHFVKPTTRIEYRNGSITLVFENNQLKGASVYVPKEELALEKIAFIADKRVCIPDLLTNHISVRQRAFYMDDTFDEYLRATNVIKDLDIPYLGVKLEVRKTSNGVKHYVVSMDSKNPYRIELVEASSGMQTTVPAHAIIEYYSRHYDLVEAINKSVLSYVSAADNWQSFKATSNVGDFPNRRVSICLEEPELSLFPDMQDRMMESVVNRMFNIEHNYSMSLLMTTHSPYIANLINVLLREPKESGINLPADVVDAYEMKDGENRSLVANDQKQGIFIDLNLLSNEMKHNYQRYVELSR